MSSTLPRTFHHADFHVRALTELARAQGEVVSVVVPARNEAAAVGTVVRRIRELVDAGLVHQLLVVDGGSTDDTARVAREAGAEVLDQDEILPEAGVGHGKGDALWKGLAATTGSLVVFVDADIADFDQRFVVGLLGPLLTRPDLGFVKAAYDRPLNLDGQLRPSGGGRVTELVARPLLASFWPELAWLIQPLSGEYAGRRALLERLPFVSGYGIELAMLVDIAATDGVEAIAQVDLGRRVHEHQSLDALGRMAAEILQVALVRAEQQGLLALSGPLGSVLDQPLREEGALAFARHRVRPRERAPLAP